MPKRYNSLNDIKTNPYEIGICPICSVRLTHGCEHSQTQIYQEWLAAVIVAEQTVEDETYETRYMSRKIVTMPAQPYTSYQPSAAELARRYDWTPVPSDMPVNFDIDKIDPVEF